MHDVDLVRGNSETIFSDRVRGFIAAGIVILCWSGFNIVSRFGTTGVLTPFDLAAMRFGVSGTLALPVFIYCVPMRDWPRYAGLAVFGGLGYGLLVYSGFAFAPSAHAGIFVNGGIPFWTVLLVAAMSGFRVARHIVIALLLSTGGLLLIGYESLFSEHATSAGVGDALFLTAALSWAIFGLLMRRWRIPPVRAILGVASISLVLYMPVYLAYLPKAIQHSSTNEIALQCIYQGLVAALLAAGMYSYANQKIGACQASMMLAVVPAGTALGAYWVLDERLTASVISGVIVVSLGALLGALPSRAARKLLQP